MSGCEQREYGKAPWMFRQQQYDFAPDGAVVYIFSDTQSAGSSLAVAGKDGKERIVALPAGFTSPCTVSVHREGDMYVARAQFCIT